MKFFNAELAKTGRKPITDYCETVTDSLLHARSLFPGKRNSLDALCDRFGISNAHRTLHGALLDAQLLAEVWLAMTRGQDALLIDVEEDASAGGAGLVLTKFDASGLPVLRADAAELSEHEGIWPRWTSPWAASACGARWNRRRAESAPRTNKLATGLHTQKNVLIFRLFRGG